MTAAYRTDPAEETVNPAEDRLAPPSISKRLRNGRRKPKGPDRRKNARTKSVFVKSGFTSAQLRRSPLDGRSAVAKAYHAAVGDLVAHVGNDPSAVQARVIDQAARLGLIADHAFRLVAIEGPIKGGKPTPALDTFLRAIREQRAALLLLGLARHTRPVPDLASYLSAGGPTSPDAEPGPGAPTWSPGLSDEATPVDVEDDSRGPNADPEAG